MQWEQPVFKQGDVGDKFYIIKQGEVRAQLGNGKVIRTMGKNDYFGERWLIFDEPRSWSIIVNANDTIMWAMEKKGFLGIMQGPILKHLEYRIQLQNTFMTMDDLWLEKTVGRGTFGTVKLVHHKTTKTRYALKCVKKVVVKEKRQE